MSVVTDRLELETRGESEMVDVTRRVQGLVDKHGFGEGQALVFVPGSTAGLTTVEFEPGLIEDVPAAFERLAPRDLHYRHEDTWHDGNGHSHVRASLLGPSVTIPFSGGQLLVGTWQQIVLIDFDNRPRRRELVVQLSGERR